MSGTEDLIKTLPWGLIGWYDLDKDERILYIGEKGDLYEGFFADNGYDHDVLSIDELSGDWAIEHSGDYGYVICIACLEKTDDPEDKLVFMSQVLKGEGCLLLGMNNRLGIRYFCGDADPYTMHAYDGIEGYYSRSDAAASAGKCYDKGEIVRMLNDAEWKHFRFYSVFPGLRDASFIFAEGYEPNEDLSNRVFPTYNDPESVLMKEGSLYPALIEGGLFHGMANAYLIECTKDGVLSDVLQVTSSLDRDREDAMYTIIRSNGTVEKRAVWTEGREKLGRMLEYVEDLKAHGIRVVDARMDGAVYTMPYIKDKVTQMRLKEALYSDRELFLMMMDRFRDTVHKSSEIVTMDDGTKVYKKGYFDLVPLNSFLTGREYVFFDQEFCIEDLPVKVMEWRQVASFYFGNPVAEKILPMDVLLKRYGLKEELPRWKKIEWEILGRILKDDKLKEYRAKYRTNENAIRSRRISIDRHCMNIFSGIEGKKLYLFGSGKYAERFLDMYGNDFPVYGLLDNDAYRQGTEKRDIIIFSPEILRDMKPESFKVMICVREYSTVVKQLEDMNVRDYSIYDPNRYYETRPRTSIRIVEKLCNNDEGTRTADGMSETVIVANVNSAEMSETDKKHYHIGYCAGAFDMFHIGHLNLLRRARERCDYLIVGVMSDERMYNLKKKYPVIPCNERMQVVAGCRYVDQVEELPADRAGIMDAYHMFHYDCMFSGDDHVNDPGWLAERERLRAAGSDIVFVSYTKEQSSSAIREKMKD